MSFPKNSNANKQSRDFPFLILMQNRSCCTEERELYQLRYLGKGNPSAHCPHLKGMYSYVCPSLMSLGWQYREIETKVAENPSSIQDFHTLLRGKQPHFLQAKYSHDPCTTLDNFQFINSVNLPILSHFQRQKHPVC